MIHSTKRDYNSIGNFWSQGWSNHQDKEVLWGNRTVEYAEADEVNESAKVSKAWKSLLKTSVIQYLKFGFILMFKKCFLVETWNIMLNFSLCYFFLKLVNETQMSQFKKHISIWDTLRVKIWVRRRPGYMSFGLCISWHFSDPLKRRSGHVDSLSQSIFNANMCVLKHGRRLSMT